MGPNSSREWEVCGRESRDSTGKYVLDVGISREGPWWFVLADWNFAVLDDEYNHLNGGPWAGLNGFANAEDLEDVGAHW